MQNISLWLLRKGVITKEDIELYNYAAMSLLMIFAPIFLAVIEGLVLGDVSDSVVMIIPFVFLRKFSGGYHANKLWKCLISSIVIIFIPLYFMRWIVQGIAINILLLISTIMLLVMSPVEHKNREILYEEAKIYKKIVLVLLLIFLSTYLFFYITKNKYSIPLALGIILTECVQLPCLKSRIKLQRNKITKMEENNYEQI